MTPDQIARKFEELSGYELLDYAAAAAPIWQLNVEAVTVVRRGLQPIREFVLRGLEADLSAEELPGFLGLDDSIVKGALADLLVDKFVSAKDEIAVTDAGRKALKEGTATPSEEVLTILFDGITRKPVASLSMDLVLPRDVEMGAFAEIPAVPPNQPALADLSLHEIDRVLTDQVGGRPDMNRDILRLKRIVRHRRLFRSVVALVFRSRKGEIRTRFVVNGVPDEQLEQHFAEHGGNLRKGLVRSFSDRHIQSSIRAHLGQEAARQVLDQTDYIARQRQVSMAALKVVALRKREAAADHGEIPPAQRPSAADIKAAEDAETVAREALMKPPARQAAVYELAELLRRALLDAKTSLSITSRGLAPHVVDKAFLKALETLIRRGVAVTIAVAEDAVEWRARGKDWAQSFDGVAQLAGKYPDRFTFKKSKEKRYFHLAWDDRVALVANRPMLSNFGRTRSFDQFAGFVMQDQDLIAGYLARRINR